MLNNLLFMVINLAVNAGSWKDSLPVVLYGMLGIFIVIGVIVGITYLLNKLTSKKPKNDNKDE